MKKDEIIEELKTLKARLRGEVVNAYKERGAAFGDERFNAWRRKLTSFLSDHLPREVSVLNEKLTHNVFSINPHDSDVTAFWNLDGENMNSYLESLILDIQNDEHDFREMPVEPEPDKKKIKDTSKVFIVHGHDGEAKERTARFIEKLGFAAIILHEQPNQGRTIIEKIEEFSNVGFGIVLYTPDDLGNVKTEASIGNLRPRARQNVVFEHGYLMAKIGRNNVAALVTADIELPNDISGVVYISDKDWQVDIAKEMKASGYAIDFNVILQ
ncbi:putative nucleotide-binding protein [Prosthecobacter fusiformis]|uniref:Putative nucleotide-binding protein n=1 Tax=Prosthecobacter fusiformis TaxID=48464 RepID=A0A4R7SRH6_9BACT|nr:nucleotide-binding protein [Prosthecobacter fusiformis]TDU81574.1 putative nucleotide-binding protein [Prosthecobacter fusiformis]